MWFFPSFAPSIYQQTKVIKIQRQKVLPNISVKQLGSLANCYNSVALSPAPEIKTTKSQTVFTYLGLPSEIQCNI